MVSMIEPEINAVRDETEIIRIIIDEFFIKDDSSWIDIEDVFRPYRESWAGVSMRKFIDIIEQMGYAVERSVVTVSKSGTLLKRPKDHAKVKGLRYSDEWVELYDK